jgi:hypothetical protein
MSAQNISIGEPSYQPSAANGSSGNSEITSEEYYKLVAEAAYYIAEQRGFAAGHDVEDWLQAEAEVNESLQ